MNTNENQTGTRDDSHKEKSQEEIYDEIRRMSEESDETGQQGKLFEDEDLGEEDLGGADDAYLQDIAQPDFSYQLYYGMWKLMKDNLPKGKKNEQGRRYIYDEVNLFLNEGKHLDSRGKRGGDSRMALIGPHLKPAFGTVVEWLQRGGVPFDLYQAFRGKNEELGYHANKRRGRQKQEQPVDIDYEDVTYDQKLKGLLAVPPPHKDKPASETEE